MAFQLLIWFYSVIEEFFCGFVLIPLMLSFAYCPVGECLAAWNGSLSRIDSVRASEQYSLANCGRVADRGEIQTVDGGRCDADTMRGR